MPGHLVDHDVNWAADLFAGEVDSGKRSDAELARYACRNELTVVTANGQDFIQEILTQQRQHVHSAPDGCSDCFGLIILPNGEYRARNGVQRCRQRGLRVGNLKITFDDVFDYNLCVTVHADGTTTIRRFPRCPYRESDDLPVWYHSLPEIGRRK